jgi:hypothetical protein
MYTHSLAAAVYFMQAAGLLDNNLYSLDKVFQ